jgi:hypothetical protein
VVVNQAVPSRDHVKLAEFRVPAYQLRALAADDTTFPVTAMCDHGDRYSVELVAVLNGQLQTPVADTIDYLD